MRSATSGAVAAGASIDTWRGDRFSSGRRCERACSMWDGGGRFVGVAGVIG
ncbi:fumarate hydratase, partial [Burkholderia pseudomallei]